VQSRRDQIQAYSFIVGRLNSGVLRVDLDSPDQPLSRTNRGMTTGLLCALLVGVVIAVYGFVVPGGNSSWKQPGAFIIVKDSGARFLYAGDELHPVLNMTSARLIAGSQMTVHTVSAASLTGARRGAPLGIVGAPDALPAASQLTRSAWSVCAVPGTDDGTATGSPSVVMRIGMPTPSTGLTGDQAILTAVPHGGRYLLWHGRRLAVGSKYSETQALGYGTVPPVPVSAAFLDAIASGPDLATPAVPGLGSPGPQLAGEPTRVGQLFVDAANRHYLLAKSGLVPLTTTLFTLYRGVPQIQQSAYGGAAVRVRVIGPSDLAQHTASAAAADPLTSLGSVLPAAPPHLGSLGSGQTLCVDLRSQDDAITVSLRAAPLSAVQADALPPDAGAGVSPSCHPASLIAIAPGSGVLVGAAPAGGGPAIAPYLVTDSAVKYPIPSAGVMTQLGYVPPESVTLPATVLSLLPTGPSLDPGTLAHGGIVTPKPAATCGD
jgi:type VII secretion protein EccB